jgi:hypothetical protein
MNIHLDKFCIDLQLMMYLNKIHLGMIKRTSTDIRNKFLYIVNMMLHYYNLSSC